MALRAMNVESLLLWERHPAAIDRGWKPLPQKNQPHSTSGGFMRPSTMFCEVVNSGSWGGSHGI
jgi:hypothetical protein